MKELSLNEISQVSGGNDVSFGVTTTVLGAIGGAAAGRIAGTAFGLAWGGPVGFGIGIAIGIGFTLANAGRSGSRGSGGSNTRAVTGSRIRRAN